MAAKMASGRVSASNPGQLTVAQETR
jgi:hypothetical protein